MENARPQYKNSTFILLYCILLSLISLGIFSYTTSPLYHEPSAGDSAIFQLLGRNWANGHLPYVSLFENKGPIIHFINCIGYLLTNSATGVFLIQWLSLSLTLIIIFRLLLFGFKAKQSYILILLPALSFSTGTWGGNCVEEYILPLMSASYLCIYKWLNTIENKNATEHPATYAIAYGMTLAFAMLTRLTNALGLCAGVAFIAIWLITKKSWHNLAVNIICFFIGFAIITLPFYAYFCYKGAFHEMWYDSIVSNFGYVNHSLGEKFTVGRFFSLIIHFIDTWVLLIISILMLILNPKRKAAATVWLLVCAFSLIWFCSGFAFQHYGVVSLPLIAISLLETKNIIAGHAFKNIKRNIAVKRIFTVGWCGYAVITILLCFHTITFSFSNYLTNSDLATLRTFMKDVPPSYKQSFIGYNTSADYYLYEDITPACRFFTTQDFGANTNTKIRHDIYNAFLRDKVEWILVKGKAQTIEPILTSRYTVYKTSGKDNLTLFHIK